VFSSEAESKTGESADSIQKYLDYCSIIYDLSKDIFIFNDFHELSTFFQPTAIKTLFNISKIDSFRTMHNAISSFFNDKKIIQLFDRYATYNGSNPYKAPATLNIIPHVEYNMGSYIVEQGISSIPQALGRLCRDLGVNIFTNKRVDSIIHKNNRINGIQIGNEKLSYDIVISNSDAYYTYTKLLKDTSSRSAKKYIRQEPSSSAMVFYWGIDCIHDFLDIHNILFSSDYEREFNDIFNNKCFSADPTIYIYISSKYNKTHAPNGHENWFVMINTSYHNNHDWHRLKSEIRKNINAKIMRMLNIDIEKKIVCESVLTPKDIETDTGSYRGSIYGISSNNRSAAFLRQSNRSKKYKGLYFCGGSVHPGGGIPLVLMSGILAARAIEKYEAINR
ncbi:MAG: FAD-dependent oxidoreductase, partial [Spirochaetota bacterium]|nr:FAD-dependent oxidoreductase [Spirochaetota bacterium]